eukprot:6203944-Pleurochrysis_carterae.AAC.3
MSYENGIRLFAMFIGKLKAYRRFGSTLTAALLPSCQYIVCVRSVYTDTKKWAVQNHRQKNYSVTQYIICSTVPEAATKRGTAAKK